MNYSKRRVIPIDVSVWMEQGVNVRRETASSGLLPNNTRSNVFLSRKFYSDMLSLSSERHKKLARFDFTKKMFLKSQRHKAEIGMPGLLPYIKQHQEEEDQEEDPRIRPTVHSVAIESLKKSTPKRPNKSRDRQQVSHERINQLSQPKGHRWDPTSRDHIRSNTVKNVNAHDLFGNIEEISNKNFNKPKEPEMSTNDKRFRKLIHLFSEMHEREPTAIQSVKSMIESNSSLQYDVKKYSSAIEYDNQSDLLNQSSYSKTDSYLIDSCT